MAVKAVLVNFAENTSAHGVNKLVERNGIILKLIWMTLLIGAAGMFVFQVSRLWEQYQRRPVSTKTSLSNTDLTFPSVTICNLNPVLNSKAQKHDIYSVVEKIAAVLNVPLSAFSSSAISNGTGLSNITFEGMKFKTDDPLQEAFIDFKMYIQSLSDDDLLELSQDFDDFLVSCYYGGEQCFRSNFTAVADRDYGVCYTFPNSSHHPKGISVYNAGPLFGLKLILNVNQKEYIPLLTPSAGVRIQVHQFKSRHHVLELGHSLSTGFETEIGVKPVFYKRLAEPYGDCDDSGNFQSVLECERECLELLIEKECGCTRDWQDPDQEDKVPLCLSSDVKCVRKVLNQKQTGKIGCDQCKPTCRVYDYTQRLSLTRWPARHYDLALLYQYSSWSAGSSIAYSPEDIRENFLALNVYFSELTLQTIKEEPAYEWESFVSDIGGQLGLWLGISVLSLCELFELIFLLGKSCTNSKHRPKTTVVSPVQP